MSDRLDVRACLADIKALAHNMKARYDMGLHNPVHEAKFHDKRRRLRERLDELDDWLDRGWLVAMLADLEEPEDE